MSDRLTQLLEMLKEMPNDAFLKYGVALEYMSRNDYPSALAHFNNLKISNPNYLALYYQLGKVNEYLSNNSQAITIYYEGIEIAKSQKDLHTLSELQNALDELLD